MRAANTVDPYRCPLCGGPNSCVMTLPESERPPGPCWCVRETFSAELLNRVPPQAQRQACICPACVAASRKLAQGRD